MPDESPFLTINQLAARWQISHDTVLRRVKQGELVGIRLGRNSYRVHKDEVEAYELRQSTAKVISPTRGRARKDKDIPNYFLDPVAIAAGSPVRKRLI